MKMPRKSDESSDPYAANKLALSDQDRAFAVYISNIEGNYAV